MPYNIDYWITKKLENLEIPWVHFFDSTKRDWHPEVEHKELNNYTLTFCGAGEIHGRVKGTIFHIDEIEFYGEGSGISMWEIFEPALKHSSGKLVASLVWECGDTINRIHVNDGEIIWEDIDI